MSNNSESYFDSPWICLSYSFDLAIKKLDEDERYILMSYKNVNRKTFEELNDSVEKLKSAKIYFQKLYLLFLV